MPTEPSELRLGLGALRELVGNIAARECLVLFVDDMHSDTLVGQITPIVADVTVDAVPATDELVVAAGRSTPVIVTASSRVGARKGLTVSGRGRGVRAERASTSADSGRDV